ncbi:GGDEF domain-containing protein [Rhizobium sp. LjRoot30]|uniref:GGDEF domain-containing protein n=1 Tax=Rhizobium sp. LjRoot30 TaxID=3342320 RepID=UPI003ECFF64D
MLSSGHWNSDDFAALRSEMAALYESTPLHIRETVTKVAKRAAPVLVQRFYRVLMEQPRADYYLNQKVVSERLSDSLQRWIVDLLPTRLPDAERLIQQQTEVGNIHARIHVPIALVLRGFRELKHGIVEDIARTRLSDTESTLAVHFISIMFDLAFSIMSAAFVVGSERAARSQEALRLFATGQDVVTEQERQRAALSEWAQTVFFHAQLGENSEILPLSQSDFGLWFVHRASLLFSASNEYDAILGAIGEVDTLSRSLRENPDADSRPVLLKSIKQSIDHIGSMLGMLFERCRESENARDPLTRVFNRRFLSTMVSREISIHNETKRPFSVVMFAIDNASKKRATYGEDDVDVIIQHTATLLFNSARRSDSVFRVGQETFLVIRVESDADKAYDFARDVANRYAMTHFDVGGKTHYENSLSFAVAEYDGHPDPKRLVIRAQQALSRN